MRAQAGFSFIEVMLALALAGILGMAVPGAITTAHKTTLMSNEHTLAESLARSQMDSIQNQTYDRTNNPPVYAVISNLPGGYSIVTPMASRLDPKGDGLTKDDGLQKITVTVKHGTKTLYTLVDYKVEIKR